MYLFVLIDGIAVHGFSYKFF